MHRISNISCPREIALESSREDLRMQRWRRRREHWEIGVSVVRAVWPMLALVLILAFGVGPLVFRLP